MVFRPVTPVLYWPGMTYKGRLKRLKTGHYGGLETSVTN